MSPASPRSFFDKVWDDHVVADLGDDAWLMHIDRHFLHELSGAVSFKGLDDAGRTVRHPELSFATIDHVVATEPGRGRSSRIPGGIDFMSGLAAGVARHRIRFFDVGDSRQGIVHVIAPELGAALPGLTLVCGDSHTTTVGGIGAMSWGIGSSDGEHVLATQTLVISRPKSMRVNFDGRLTHGVYAKDMVLALIAAIGADGGIGHAVEFAGEAVRALPIEGRLTICNMAAEMSARLGFVAPDATTLAFLHGRTYAPKGALWQSASDYWLSLASDEGAAFDREVRLDCNTLAPQVTWGTSPEHVVAIDAVVPRADAARDETGRRSRERALAYMDVAPGQALQSLPITGAFIGSCTNSRLDDLRSAAAVLRGRRVADGVRAICVPGSTAVKHAAESEGLAAVFISAGFEWRESGCSLCMSAGGESFARGSRVISTTNRNFEDRQGPRVRSHLASPATVAASAVLGRVADPRPLLAH